MYLPPPPRLFVDSANVTASTCLIEQNSPDARSKACGQHFLLVGDLYWAQSVVQFVSNNLASRFVRAWIHLHFPIDLPFLFYPILV